MHDSPSWDSYTLDIAYTLVLNYMDSIRSDYDSHTWKDLADYIIDIASRDDAGQVYKYMRIIVNREFFRKRL